LMIKNMDVLRLTTVSHFGENTRREQTHEYGTHRPRHLLF
jgi:hypothetical protein